MLRFVSLLLIPFFVLGQPLPHSHAGSHVSEPSDHAERPHVHLHSHGHSHDHHQHAADTEATSASDVVSLAAEHDSDAIYLASKDQSSILPANSISIDVFATDWVLSWISSVVDSEGGFRGQVPLHRAAKLPLFLLTGSLRL